MSSGVSNDFCDGYLNFGPVTIMMPGIAIPGFINPLGRVRFWGSLFARDLLFSPQTVINSLDPSLSFSPE